MDLATIRLAAFPLGPRCVGHEHVHFTAPPRERLEEELDCFLAWFNTSPAGLDGLIRAGLAHLWFVTLHPFEDGNGRLARAITDMALSRDERQALRFFSLSAQILRERESYYSILERTQRSGLDVTDWLVWFLEQVAASATTAEKTLADTLAKARFWLRHQGTELNERQRKVLNRLLDAGQDGFIGGIVPPTANPRLSAEVLVMTETTSTPGDNSMTTNESTKTEINCPRKSRTISPSQAGAWRFFWERQAPAWAFGWDVLYWISPKA